MPYVNKGLSTKIGPFIKDISGSTITINNQFNDHLLSLKSDIVAMQTGSGVPNPENIRAFTGWDSVDLSVNGVIKTIDLGETYYGGVLDVTNGMLTINKGYRVFNGSENWHEYLTFPYHYQMVISNLKRVEKGVASSHFESLGGMANNSPSVTQAVFAADGNRARFKYSSCADLTEWKAYVKDQYDNGTPIQIVYELTNPIEVQLTPTQIDLIIGDNTIFADSGDIEAIYKTFIP